MYAELHCISNFSFLRGASRPEELVIRAKQLNYGALAITDECSLAGVVRAHVAAKEVGLKLIIGSEFHMDGLHLVLLAPNRQAYGQLSQLITLARRRSEKGEYNLEVKDLEHRQAQLSQCFALWISDHRQDRQLNFALGKRLKDCFAERLWIALAFHLEADDLDKAAEALTLSMRLQLPIVATGGAHMHVAERQPLQDLLTGIRLGMCVTQAGRLLDANRERHLRTFEQLRQLYPYEALQESLAIADQCHFSLDELRYEYPPEVVPQGHNATSYLRELTFFGAQRRWPEGIPAAVQKLLEKELNIIAELGYEHFFLTVYDIVQFARSNQILCQGRGSAANSAVCYCLQITEVDPARMSVLFERFISKERNEPPDIDVDFEHERREEVIQYLYKRYGRERTALTATVVSYRPRSAVRDVGKALGLAPALVDHLAKSLAWWDNHDHLFERFRGAGINDDNPIIQQFLHFIHEILGFPRHLSQHVGGFVIAATVLADLVPIENAAMAERTVIQWDKDDLDALGLLKVDVLALGMLTAIRKSFALVNDFRPERPDLHLSLDRIPAEDGETYEMLQRGDSVGVFQVESRAQMSMLPRLKPKEFYDLVIEVAIVRPGPIQGNMVPPFLRRRQGLETISYPNEAIKGVLHRTLGVPIFQEQVIQLAMVAAGFSAGEADALRRAMAAWKRRGGLEPFGEKLINGMLSRGHDRDFAERVFAQIKGFGEYGFPESHAASFALLVYVSAWLKCHEPAAFYCALMNSQPMGFYSPSQIVQDAQRHNIETRSVDVCCSHWDHVLESPSIPQSLSAQGHQRTQGAIRLGLRLVAGFDAAAAQRLVQARKNQAFSSIDDLTQRCGLDRHQLGCLAKADALSTLLGNRHHAHWAVRAVDAERSAKSSASNPSPTPQPEATLLTTHSMATPSMGVNSKKVAEANSTVLAIAKSIVETPVSLPTPSLVQDVSADYSTLGLSLKAHPMSLLRSTAAFRNCVRASDLLSLPHGRFARVAGVVTGRQRPGTASGVIFMTLEDETGNTNVVIWNSVLARFRHIVLRSRLVLIKGVVEREGAVVHLIAGYLTDMDGHFDTLDVHSRDFH